MKLTIVLLVFLHCLVHLSNGYRILGLFTMPAHSHYALGSRLMKELAERGHEVTIITPFKEKNPPKNYREIFLEGIVELGDEEKKQMFQRMDISALFMLFMMGFMAETFTKPVFDDPKVKEFVNNPAEKFDLVIVEQFVNDAQKAFAYHFDAPLIALSTLGSGPWVNSLVGNPAPRSYVPDILAPYNGTMNFWQRLDNLFLGFVGQIVNRLILFPKMNKLAQTLFPGAPSVQELNQNVSLVLLNSHPSISQPLPHVPNMIEIGGYHIYPSKPLPKDLKEYLDNAKEGVVYFSMGSNLKSKFLPAEKRDGILKAFSKLKHQVLWKFEDDNLPGKPKNVKIEKWLPQQDIFTHPNIKVFITHGGILSTIEAIYYGIPVVGIPIFGDQKLNMATAVASGYGLLINYADLTEETLSAAVNEVLSNPKYRENAKARSKILHDQPIKPLDNAIFWTEYVARHKGAPHLRSAALDLYWYQYYMIDVLAFVAVVTIAANYLTFLGLRAILRRRRRSQVQKPKKTN